MGGWWQRCLNADLSSFGKQHLNDNEYLKVALKKLSNSANSLFKVLRPHGSCHLVFSRLSDGLRTDGDMFYPNAPVREQVRQVCQRKSFFSVLFKKHCEQRLEP